MKYLKNRGKKVKNNKTQQAITCQGQVHMNKKKNECFVLGPWNQPGLGKCCVAWYPSGTHVKTLRPC